MFSAIKFVVHSFFCKIQTSNFKNALTETGITIDHVHYKCLELALHVVTTTRVPYERMCTQEAVKRFEQHAEDHSQYEAARDQCATWCESCRQQLAVCGDTSGDRSSVQAQLEHLQVRDSMVDGDCKGFDKNQN